MNEPNDAESHRDLGDLLRRGDPAAGRKLDPAAGRRMLAQLRAATAAPAPSHALGPLAWAAVATVVLGAGVAWLAWPGADSPALDQRRPEVPRESPEGPSPKPSSEPVAVPEGLAETAPAVVTGTPTAVAPPADRSAPTIATDRASRSLQFTAPGGTRIVWTLDPDFELGAATR